jgi:predicted kinase
LLIVFGGLPGVGKTTVAKALARELRAVYLRVDTIEQVLRREGVSVWAHGYEVGYALAEENLRLGRVVVADSVNPLKLTREAWLAVAARAGVRAVEFELVCSDKAAHRRRVESRVADNPGHDVPNWDAVMAHDYEPWDRPPAVVDTAGRAVEEIVQDVQMLLI